LLRVNFSEVFAAALLSTFSTESAQFSIRRHPRDRRKQLGTSEWLGGDGRIQVEKINWPFLFEFKGNPAEYSAGPQARDRAPPA
jgi:hypothetical protein